jgi:hypothetical protein
MCSFILVNTMDKDDKKIRLPWSHLCASRRLMLLGAVLAIAGLLLALFGSAGPWSIAAWSLGSVGVAIAISSAFYWSCDNKTCS